ncbi:MAG: hypothetical protein CVV44_05070 [Spirochaetae bacterium HGW-Spirochaetae-1]|nr:MAG: hypothetical protein CVV44_05070 [Spirochaetae bacterium HGW-Spirochaetae-1]
MRNKIKLPITLIVFLLIIIPFSLLRAWDLHTLISYPVFSSMKEVTNRPAVKAESLESFLAAVEGDLQAALEKEEAWARKNMAHYAPVPEALVFRKTGNRDDIIRRFTEAIRINPLAKLRLYLELLPGENTGGRPLLAPEAVSVFQDNEWLKGVTLVSLREGEAVTPLQVLVSANDEPDLGLDVGLYTDNKTEYGRRYGFGVQPFGNPNLEYGSQAPFHMGFYHESSVVFKAAPFLKQSYPEYRIHLYKSLAELAFRTGHDYWGWRFTGWGLHYLTDLAQPYHAQALPGVGTTRMIFINLLDMMGIHGPKNKMIQIVSNRHTAMEKFERLILEKAYRENNSAYYQFQILGGDRPIPAYNDSVPRNIIAAKASAISANLDEAIEDNMPERLVSDPKFELGTSREQYVLLDIIAKEKGDASVKKLESMMGNMLEPFSLYGRAYIVEILKSSNR